MTEQVKHSLDEFSGIIKKPGVQVFEINGLTISIQHMVNVVSRENTSPCHTYKFKILDGTDGHAAFSIQEIQGVSNSFDHGRFIKFLEDLILSFSEGQQLDNLTELIMRLCKSSVGILQLRPELGFVSSALDYGEMGQPISENLTIEP